MDTFLWYFKSPRAGGQHVASEPEPRALPPQQLLLIISSLMGAVRKCLSPLHRGLERQEAHI